jgi:hypothetical protein
MQPAHGDSVLDGTCTQPDIHKLPPRRNPMLSRSEPRYLTLTPPSPSRPTYIGGGDELGGHRAMISPATLRVVRSV